jgi:hypothetical protein
MKAAQGIAKAVGELEICVVSLVLLVIRGVIKTCEPTLPSKGEVIL